MTVRVATFVLLAALVAPSAPVSVTASEQAPAEPIATALRQVPKEAARAPFEGDLPAITRFYEARRFAPAWTTGTALNLAGQGVLRELQQAADEGLTASDYLIAPMAALASRADAESAASLEVMVSLAAARYAHDLGWGITLPSEVDKGNAYDNRPFDANTVLSGLTAAADAGAALHAYEPPTFVYRQMKQALLELRAIQSGAGWKTASAGPTLKPRDSGSRVQELRTLLIERGDLPPSASSGDTFDADLAAGLRRFQSRHGLHEDAVYGKDVVAAFNVPIGMRIQQLRLAMERLRWLPPASSGRRIAVNLADFRAYVFDGDSIAFETRAVIGRLYSETPMFTALMTYVVINPYWNVPPSITRSEIVPKINADPGYLAKNHMEMNGGVVRQLPGPWNSLGRFKFMFPNAHNIYLHDTPARTLFAQADRAFSHGCVRLEQPADLAALLLGGQGWTAERIAATVAGGRETVVTLATPIPVTISYATAFRTPDGLLHYRSDIYGRDRKLLAALQRRSEGSWEE